MIQPHVPMSSFTPPPISNATKSPLAPRGREWSLTLIGEAVLLEEWTKTMGHQAHGTMLHVTSQLKHGPAARYWHGYDNASMLHVADLYMYMYNNSNLGLRFLSSTEQHPIPILLEKSLGLRLKQHNNIMML